eukprot:TRINITY_DN1413_c0_g1_i1.p1 TRINITY_DN1413_c0_g1~~TRINITY_DN1413_c0_g1_i1.p1  ORF type:complete len:472 (+),score=173.35 TRINITY_DN1413_c0_g1_i1:839-2254(+)
MGPSDKGLPFPPPTFSRFVCVFVFLQCVSQIYFYHLTHSPTFPPFPTDFASFDNMDVEDENDDDVWDIEDMDETLSEAKEAYSNMNADAELEKNKAAGLVRATESITLDGQKVDIGDEDLATKMMQDIYTNEQQTNEEINDMDEASRSAAYIAAELSADVYENTKIGKYKTIKGQRYYVRYRFTHNKSGANAAIYENGNNIYLVFEGTKNEWRLKDWKTNLKINKKSCIARDGDNYGKCHSGFRDSYNLIASLNNDQLMKAVKAYKAKGRRLTLTGHSLGGALATMAALDIKARSGYGRNFDIITFGSPRVGDSTFIRKWDANFGARSDRYVMEFKAGTCPFSDNHGTRVEDDVEDSDFWRRRRRRRRGGFFKKVGKGISKAAKKVAKGVKKVAKGVAKVAKKVVKAVVGKKRTGRDLVTRIPPKSFGFSHVIREKILTSKHSCSLYCCHKYNILLMIKVHAIKDYAALLK